MADQRSNEHGLTPEQMLAELIEKGYLVAAPEDHQPIMPTAFRNFPTITTTETGSRQLAE